MDYIVIRRPTRKSGPEAAVVGEAQTTKNGNARLREFGCNVPVGSKSTYQTPRGKRRGYEFVAKPVKGDEGE